MSRLKSHVFNPVEKLANADAPFVALEHVESGMGRLIPGVELLPKVTDDSVAHRAGDVLFGKLRPYLAKSVLMEEDGVGSSELLVLRPRENLEPKFLWYLTLTSTFLDWAVATSYGVKMPRTSWRQISEMPFSVPSLEEQRQIVQLLDAQCAEIDALLVEQETMLKLLEEHGRTAVKNLVTGSDVPGQRTYLGPWWLRDTPSTWTAYKISRNFKTGSGTTPTSTETRYYGGVHPWLNTSECRDSIVFETAKTVTDEALNDFSALKYYPAGSLVIAMYGATIGRLAVLGVPMTVNQACVVLSEPNRLDPWFTYWWLWAHRPEIMDLGAGGGQPNISQGLVRQLIIPAPALSVQREIVEMIEASQAASGALRAECELQESLLRDRRKALITKAIFGSTGENA